MTYIPRPRRNTVLAIVHRMHPSEPDRGDVMTSKGRIASYVLLRDSPRWPAGRLLVDGDFVFYYRPDREARFAADISSPANAAKCRSLLAVRDRLLDKEDPARLLPDRFEIEHTDRESGCLLNEGLVTRHRMR